MASFVFVVEGPDDELFFKRVIVPVLESKSDDKFYVLVAKGYSEDDYKRQFRIYDNVIIVRDLDEDACPARKKNEICNVYNLHDKKSDICIVINEIESWYVAVGSHTLPRLSKRFQSANSTEWIKKEDFNREMRTKYPNLFKNRSSLLIELLKEPNMNDALRRNSSLRYLAEKIRSKNGLELVIR